VPSGSRHINFHYSWFSSCFSRRYRPGTVLKCVWLFSAWEAPSSRRSPISPLHRRLTNLIFCINESLRSLKIYLFLDTSTWSDRSLGFLPGTSTMRLLNTLIAVITLVSSANAFFPEVSGTASLKISQRWPKVVLLHCLQISLLTCSYRSKFPETNRCGVVSTS
jgi:hypothetical protein